MVLKDSFDYAGKSYPVNDAEYKATGALVYASDMTLPGMLYMELVCSERAHAEITSVDARSALKCRGVAEVFTHWNSTDKKYNHCRKTTLQQNVPEDKALFTSRARYAGDVIAAVVAETRERQQDMRDRLQLRDGRGARRGRRQLPLVA